MILCEENPKIIGMIKDIFNMIPDRVDIEFTKLHTFQHKKFTQTNLLAARSRLGFDENSHYLKVAQYVDKKFKRNDVDLYLQFKSFLKTLQFEYTLGDELHKITDLDCLNDENIMDWSSELGQVSVIQFWTSWCGFSLTQMQYILTLMESNKEWEGKVKFIAISMDDEIEHWKLRITDEKLYDKQIQHFRFKKGWDLEQPVLRALQLEELPEICVIDKWNKIKYQGHPKNVELASYINELLKEELNTQQILQQQKQMNDDDVYQSRLCLKQQEFNDLKQKLQGPLTDEMKKYTVQGIFFIEMMEKYKILHRNLQKIPLVRSRINVYLYVNKSSVEVARRLILKIQEIIADSNLINLDNFRIMYTDGKVSQDLKKIFAAQQIDICFKEIKYNLYKYKRKIDAFKYIIPSSKYVPMVVRKEDDQKNQQKLNQSEFIKLNEKLNEFISNLSILEDQECAKGVKREVMKEFQFGIGDKFQKFNKYIGQDKKQKEIISNQGEVMVLVYWSHHDTESIKIVNECYQIIKEMKCNDQHNKVRMVILAFEAMEIEIDQQLDLINEEVRTANFFEFYFPQTKEISIDKELYNVRSFPYYIIVDQQGIIRAVGQKVNFKLVVTELLNGTSKMPQVKKQVQSIEKEKYDSLKFFIESDTFKGMLNELGDKYQFKLEIVIVEVIIEDSIKSIYQIPELIYSIREVKLPILQQFLIQLFDIVPEQQLKIQSEITKTFDVPFPGIECQLCKQKLNKDMAQYYNPFTNAFLCTDCAENNDKTKVGLARYKCSDTLIFINAPLNDMSVLKEIDEYKKGKNLKIKENEEGSQNHDMYCNGCGENQLGPRYIAVNCRPGKIRNDGYVDICSTCFEMLKVKDSEEAKTIIKRNEGENLTSDCLFTRILFSISYYEF